MSRKTLRRGGGERFADPGSPARKFRLNPTDIARDHIAGALTSELSRVETPAIRKRMVAHLPLSDQWQAECSAADLALAGMPRPHQPACALRTDLPPSDALSIMPRGPRSLRGRKLGILITDGVGDALRRPRRRSEGGGRGVGTGRGDGRQGDDGGRQGEAGAPADRRWRTAAPQGKVVAARRVAQPAAIVRRPLSAMTTFHRLPSAR